MELTFWKKLKDYDYFVSNTGRIKSARYDKEIFAQTANGMAVVSICKAGRTQNKRLDMLVASCFLKASTEGQMMIHLNGDNMNCRENNLFWMLPEANLEKIYGEKWKLVNDSNVGGLYYVSSDGRIWSSKTEKLMSIRVHNGYPACSIGWPPSFRHVHTLVAKAFLPNSKKLPVVNHKDGNRTNNTIDNLEWCTYSENSLHARTLHRRKPTKSKKEKKPIGGRPTGVDGYTIFEDGRVYSDKSKTFLISYPNDNGYPRVRLDGSYYSVHSLIAKAFLPPPEDGANEINHKDGDKTNNSIGNLEWCSHSQNMKHCASMYQKNHERTKKSVVQLSLQDEIITTFSGIKEASRATGVNSGSIIKSCKGVRPTAGGFKWRYKNKP